MEEVQGYLDGFFKTYLGVQRYVDSTKAFAIKHGFVYTYTGRRRRFPILLYTRNMKGRVGRQAVNARIQTTSSDILSTNLLDVDREILKPMNGRMLLTVHDSMLFQLPKGVSGIKAKLDKVLLENTKERFPWLPVPWKFDVGMGPRYGRAKYEVA